MSQLVGHAVALVLQVPQTERHSTRHRELPQATPFQINVVKGFDHVLPLTEPEPKEKEASAPPEAAAKAEAKKERMPRLDWAGLLRRTFVLDVFASAGCGGWRRVLAT
ncbi:hypothetical protein [Cystobacter fuscus]|uniref:hypothetical protein n=1 Tax=Cystobacter fuscus TaxID=43 RepID=UPI0037C1593E